MTSLLAKLTLLLYVTAAGIGVADVALHGPYDHSHDGQPCQIHHHTSQPCAQGLAGDAGPSAPAAYVTIAYREVAAPLTAAEFQFYKSRDPPARLFS